MYAVFPQDNSYVLTKIIEKLLLDMSQSHKSPEGDRQVSTTVSTRDEKHTWDRNMAKIKTGQMWDRKGKPDARLRPSNMSQRGPFGTSLNLL